MSDFIRYDIRPVRIVNSSQTLLCYYSFTCFRIGTINIADILRATPCVRIFVDIERVVGVDRLDIFKRLDSQYVPRSDHGQTFIERVSVAGKCYNSTIFNDSVFLYFPKVVHTVLRSEIVITESIGYFEISAEVGVESVGLVVERHDVDRLGMVADHTSPVAAL